MAGGCGLAFGAAFTNTGLILYTGTSVSHLTGDIAKFSVDITRLSPEIVPEALRVGLAAVSFLFGAVLAGLLIHRPALDFSRPYGRTITSIGMMLIASSWLVECCPLASISLAACGCGLQNALAAHYRGIVLRTTHLTGLFTDFGVSLGMRLRRYEIPGWKMAVPLLLIVFFFMGGVCAAAVHYMWEVNIILLAGVAYCVAGMGWSLWKRGFHSLWGEGQRKDL